MPTAADRTLLIGFDGATWDLLDPALKAGALPHLSRFLAGATRGRLRSVEPPVTIPAWYSATTGLSPATLDMWGFTAPASTPGKFRLVTTYRPHDALWDRLGRRGWRVGVVNFPALPAPPVHGYFISGMLDPRGQTTTYPPSLLDRLRRELGGWDHDLPEFGPGEREKALERAALSMDRKARAVEMLQGEHHPDLLFVLFSETDRVQHNHWDALAAFPRTKDPAVRRYWGALDSAFHRVRAAFDADAGGLSGTTWLLSDHGFGPAQGYFFTNRFLERRGYLVTRGRASATARLRPWITDVMARTDEALPLRAPLGLADHLRHRMAPRSQERDGDALDQTFGWFSQFVDWKRTRAFSFPVPEAIYANTFDGPVPEKERQRLKKEISRELTSLGPAQVRVVDPEVLYGKPVAPTAPLLLLESREGAWETRGDTNHRVDYLARRPSYFQRQGTHRPQGILAVAGPRISSGSLGAPVAMLSVLPTLLRALGFEEDGPFDGRFDPALLRALGS
ncbi:MAG: alkaline phosphatase family protein [Euryarchaeota archaeon]|nr:alkaline phosphatase family protein [Euryarchaeota archaeon]MDE1837736.1 alkaline phosphatase family protein [Euryarchaeota archaeon]MDE1880938.1 alkaline phosphatase family protein [Euryarchaeota archaeon]MDE2046101.1 alkaline phosphatase family protein [Thermoplasmata archaeon]